MDANYFNKKASFFGRLGLEVPESIEGIYNGNAQATTLNSPISIAINFQYKDPPKF